MKTILTLFLGALSCAAQATAIYTASRSTALTSAAEVITIQAPAAGGTTTAATIHMKGVAVYCSVACDFTLERDGTAATTTVLTPASLNKSGPGGTPTAGAYRSSNVGNGTTLSQYTLSASGLLTLDLSDKYLGAGENITVRTSAITGTAKINFTWEEK